MGKEEPQEELASQEELDSQEELVSQEELDSLEHQELEVIQDQVSIKSIDCK